MIADFPTDDSSSPELIAAWDDANQEFCAVADTLTAEDWATPSKLTGWSVGDLVAHIAHLDGLLIGDPQVDHAPDWAVLTHAQTPFQKLTEYGVDVRRSRSQTDVLAELHRVADQRREQLLTVDTTQSLNFIGMELTFNRLMRRRTLDTWVHLLDICYALDRPWPPQDSPAARVTAGMWVENLPRLLAKEAAAPIGSVLRIVCTGPDVEFDVRCAVDSGGRGMWVADSEPANATIELSWLHFVALSAGRIPRAVLDTPVDGDAALAESFLAVMAVTP